MTAPLRRYLLNHEIKLAARRIAHAWTKTCKYQGDDIEKVSDVDDEHTRNCNAMTREIEALAMHVKMAAVQPPQRRQPEKLSEDAEAANEGSSS